jgi:uncharacterized protein
MPYSIDWKSSSSDLPADLWAACFPPHREGLWWYQTFERAGLEDQFRFLYAAISHNQQLVGIAPAFVFDVPMELSAPPAVVKLIRLIDHGPLKRLTRTRTLFLGSVAAEEGVVGLLPGHNLVDVVPALHAAALAQAKLQGAGMLVWKDFEDYDAPALDPLVSPRSCFKIPSYPGTSVPLLPGGFDAHLAAMKSSRRHQIKKKLKRGRELGKLDISIVVNATDAIIAEIFPLFMQTYEKGATKFERLGEEWFRQIAKHEPSHFLILRDPANNGRAVAFMLCFKMGSRAINKFIGIDYPFDAGNRYLYFQLFAAAYDWAATTGAQVFQSGQTGYRAKMDLGHTLVPLHNYCHHRVWPLHRLFSAVTSGVTWETLDPDLKTYLAAHPGDAAGE